MSFLRRLALSALATTGLVAAAAPAASAAHLQGGFFTASTTADGHLKGTFTYLERIACGSGGVGSQRAIPGVSVKSPNGETLNVSPTGTATVCRTNEAVYEAPFDYNISGSGPVDSSNQQFQNGTPDGNWTIDYRNGNRVAGIANYSNSNSGYVHVTAQVRKVTGQTSSAPILGSNAATGISVIRQDPQNLNASDPDGGTLTYSTALKTNPTSDPNVFTDAVDTPLDEELTPYAPAPRG